MEAATHGVPSVGYREAVGVAESIVDEVTGRVVDDERAFVNALRTLLMDQELRTQLGEAGRRRAEAFSWGATATTFGALLSRVVSKGAEAGGCERPDTGSHAVHTVALSGRPAHGPVAVPPGARVGQRVP
jgi:hypothetical protein